MASALETLNQLASTAAKAVWGESNDAETHKEPISGATGDVSKGEPYDAGNLDPQAQSKVESTLKDGQATPSEPANDQHYTLSSSKRDQDSLSAAATSAINEGVAEPRSAPTTAGTINPEQGKPLDELAGKGPRPVEELAAEHGGDAAAAATAAAETDSSTAVSAVPEEKKKPELAGNEHEATGEQHVKSSGLAADGGDFDAANPGAGQEADRLLEQKGIKVDEGDPKDKNGSSSSNGRKSSDSSRRDKPKLKERIKNKLHMH